MNSSEKVTVELGERSYDIIFNAIESNAVVEAFAALPQKNVLIAADSNTARYLDKLAASLQAAGKTVYSWVFPAGEASKNIDNAMKLCAYAAELKLGRNALFAALGGGVTGDLTGFAASVYMRGVDFIQIPTSLLAMVDSSVGGKTAVDTAHGKNLVGAFHQPELVVIDCSLLQTLAPREIASGMAEIVKTAMILDRNFAVELQNHSFAEFINDLSKLQFAVKRSCEIKAAVVSADEKESGDSGRVFLNYGHTFGHALEHLSSFALAHGEAVAIGMDIAVFVARDLGLCQVDVMDFQHELLEKFNIAPESFPTSAIKRDAARIVALMKGDKKNGDGKFRAVLPVETGKVQTVDLDPEKTAELLDKYFHFRFDSAAPVADKRPEVAIVGLGLLGASMALSVDHSKYMVSVWNRNPEACRAMAECQAAEKIYATAEEAIANGDIVILCLPIPVTMEFIRKYHEFLKPGAVMTDISSVKGCIIKCASEFPDLNFVGSHPMAGTEKSSWRSAVKGLYENADILIVPGKYSTAEGIATVKAFWKSLNSHIKDIDCDSHDALVANSSHMLHIIASALTRSILDRSDAVEQRRYYSGCATGFRDTSRIASSSPAMWRDICISNTGAIMPALDEFQYRLAEIRRTLVQGDGEKFAELFALGRDLRDSWLCYKKSHDLPQNIVLCGIKHCGKTTVGREIAAVLDIKFVDSDDLIVEKDGGNRSVREIFAAEGEDFFRKLEAQVLSELAESGSRKVIALGGGALSNPFVSEEVKTKLGFKVWLDTDDKIAFARIVEKGLPPFLQNADDPEQAFRAMNVARKAVFARQCEVRCVPAATPHYTALHILSLYKDKWL